MKSFASIAVILTLCELSIVCAQLRNVAEKVLNAENGSQTSYNTKRSMERQQSQLAESFYEVMREIKAESNNIRNHVHEIQKEQMRDVEMLQDKKEFSHEVNSYPPAKTGKKGKSKSGKKDGNDEMHSYPIIKKNSAKSTRSKKNPKVTKGGKGQQHKRFLAGSDDDSEERFLADKFSYPNSKKGLFKKSMKIAKSKHWKRLRVLVSTHNDEDARMLSGKSSYSQRPSSKSSKLKRGKQLLRENSYYTSSSKKRSTSVKWSAKSHKKNKGQMRRTLEAVEFNAIQRIQREDDDAEERSLQEDDDAEERSLKEDDDIDERFLQEDDDIDERTLQEDDDIDERTLQEDDDIDERTLQEDDDIDERLLQQDFSYPVPKSHKMSKKGQHSKSARGKNMNSKKSRTVIDKNPLFG